MFILKTIPAQEYLFRLLTILFLRPHTEKNVGQDLNWTAQAWITSADSWVVVAPNVICSLYLLCYASTTFHTQKMYFSPPAGRSWTVSTPTEHRNNWVLLCHVQLFSWRDCSLQLGDPSQVTAQPAAAAPHDVSVRNRTSCHCSWNWTESSPMGSTFGPL